MAIAPEIRFKRYLCYANEANIYYPGCRFSNKRYNLESVPSLNELLDADKLDDIMNIIKTFHEQRISCYPDAMLYILSELARDKKKRRKCLELAATMCEKTEQFIIFLKFSLENSPRIGFGRTFRKFVRTWYSGKDYLQLAEIVGELRKFRGWSHADLIKLAHVKSSDPAKAAIFKYAVNGVDAMKKDYGEIEDAKKVVEYLSTVEDYRKRNDATEVSEKIDSYMLGYYHVNFLLHEDKKVWLALLKQMPVLQVLNHFQFMSKKKMFRNNRNWDVVFVDTIIEALTKPFANLNGVRPNRVFIELMNYENAGRVKMELANRMKRVSKKPPIIHPDLSNAFISLMDTTFEAVKPTGRRIMIAIELSHEMLKRRCYVSRYIALYEAAVFIAYYFAKTEQNVKVFTYNSIAMEPFVINKDARLKMTLENFKSENIPEIPIAQKSKGDEYITNWLREHGTRTGTDEVDICIILKSYLDNNSLHALVSGAFANKKIKFIVSDLCGLPKSSRPPDKRSLFVTSGFDEKLIDAMSLFISDIF